MLNQQVSIHDIDRPDACSTALSPLPSHADVWAVDPDLNARLTRAAAASGLPSPDVYPGAAVHLSAVDLPLTSDRKRRAAALFAMEPNLASGLEGTHVAVGPALHGTVRLCAAVSADNVDMWAKSARPIVPDLCAVPLPHKHGHWSVWCGAHAVYVRTDDGSGCVLAKDGFADVWRGFDRPPLELCHGTLPPGTQAALTHDVLPPVDPSIFELDLRRDRAGRRKAWRGRFGFALALSALAGAAHAAVVFVDARALERLATARTAEIISQSANRGATLDLSLPASILTADLVRGASVADAPDPFLTLLARTGTALTGRGVDFRNLRFDGDARTMTILISAPDLGALQRAEDALRADGLTVVSGAASSGAAGAEMQVVLSEAR
ncbi:type II secretion system protein GspL [uncultured Tateyamaria sp.]|uniref:type II secretion system protein GspL n=1 Tax=Tateyamaria sp. 1078 TaxID=3417464 RepID=UPI00262AAB3C|nr:type II secretion system protein GspL [uncultured Tateyamaria sp.]